MVPTTTVGLAPGPDDVNAHLVLFWTVQGPVCLSTTLSFYLPFFVVFTNRQLPKFQKTGLKGDCRMYLQVPWMHLGWSGVLGVCCTNPSFVSWQIINSNVQFDVLLQRTPGLSRPEPGPESGPEPGPEPA